MKYTRIFTLASVLFLLGACSAVDTADNNRVGPEYYDGRTMGEKHAKMDAARIKCNAIKPVPSSWARKHNPILEEQGRSKMFKQGFYAGYRKELVLNWEMRCN